MRKGIDEASHWILDFLRHGRLGEECQVILWWAGCIGQSSLCPWEGRLTSKEQAQALLYRTEILMSKRQQVDLKAGVHRISSGLSLLLQCSRHLLWDQDSSAWGTQGCQPLRCRQQVLASKMSSCLTRCDSPCLCCSQWTGKRSWAFSQWQELPVEPSLYRLLEHCVQVLRSVLLPRGRGAPWRCLFFGVALRWGNLTPRCRLTSGQRSLQFWNHRTSVEQKDRRVSSRHLLKARRMAIRMAPSMSTACEESPCEQCAVDFIGHHWILETDARSAVTTCSYSSAGLSVVSLIGRINFEYYFLFESSFHGFDRQNFNSSRQLIFELKSPSCWIKSARCWRLVLEEAAAECWLSQQVDHPLWSGQHPWLKEFAATTVMLLL